MALTKLTSVDKSVAKKLLSGLAIQVSTVAEMKTKSYEVGQVVETVGYYAESNAGAARYLVKAAQAFDGYGDHELVNGNIAVLQVGNAVNISSLGVLSGVPSDGLAIKYAIENYSVVDCEGIIIDITAGISASITTNTILKCFGAKLTTTGATEIRDPLKITTTSTSTMSVDGLEIDGNAKLAIGIEIIGNSRVTNCTSHNLYSSTLSCQGFNCTSGAFKSSIFLDSNTSYNINAIVAGSLGDSQGATRNAFVKIDVGGEGSIANISNNKFTDCFGREGDNIQIVTSTDQLTDTETNIVVRDNIIKNAGRRQIKLQSHNTKILNNTLETMDKDDPWFSIPGTAPSAGCIASTANNDIIGNTIVDRGTTASDITATNSTKGVISRNKIYAVYNDTTLLITATGCEGMTIDSNKLLGGIPAISVLNSDSISVIDNYFYHESSSTTGAYPLGGVIDGSNIHLLRNEFVFAASVTTFMTALVQISAGASNLDGLRIEGNTISGGTGTGTRLVYFFGSTVSDISVINNSSSHEQELFRFAALADLSSVTFENNRSLKNKNVEWSPAVSDTLLSNGGFNNNSTGWTLAGTTTYLADMGGVRVTNDNMQQSITSVPAGSLIRTDYRIRNSTNLGKLEVRLGGEVLNGSPEIKHNENGYFTFYARTQGIQTNAYVGRGPSTNQVDLVISDLTIRIVDE